MDSPPPMSAPEELSGAVPPQPVPAAAPAADFPPAGFWIRAGAYMIDGLIITICQVIVMTLLTLVGIPNAAARGLSALLGVAYFVWMPVACAGQTLGKMAGGIAIRRMDGSPLTYLRCLGRWCGYLVSGILAGLGFLLAAFTDKKRGLHDYMADTRVIYIQEVSTGRKTAVILCGLLFLLVPLVGIMAAVSIPQLSQLANKSQEGSNLGNLGSLRAGSSIFYGDTEGTYPQQLADLVPKHVPQIPVLKLKDHAATAEVAAYDASVCSGRDVDPTKIKDTGKWGYVSDPKAPCWGTVFVDCTHTDSKQKPWVSY